MMPMRHRRGRVAAAILIALVACSPALDWRDARPGNGALLMLFPCRPEHSERMVALAAERRPMHLYTCRADAATFSLLSVELAEPAHVTASVEALRASATANIGGTAAAQPFVRPGATPNPQSAQLRIEGRLPDGRRVIEHAAFFVRGLTLYQATVLGENMPADAAETFFSGIRLTP